MKKAYILLLALLALVFFSFVLLLNLNISSYAPRLIKDLKLYLQANILAQDSKELAKYFLYKAQTEGKECLQSVEFNYPTKNDTIKIEYFYVLADCKNFKIKHQQKPKDLNESLIILNISVSLNAGEGVNEEVFVNHKNVIYPKNRIKDENLQAIHKLN